MDNKTDQVLRHEAWTISRIARWKDNISTVLVLLSVFRHQVDQEAGREM